MCFQGGKNDDYSEKYFRQDWKLVNMNLRHK